ncbi:MAG: DoxX family protein [Minicystis sp.]
MLLSKYNKAIYWVLTLISVVPAGLGGLVEVFTDGPASIVAIMQHIGYPLYVMKILGTAKALGMVAIVSGKFPRLKEWAYAGFTIELLGAAASHALARDSAAAILFPLVMLLPVLASYGLWHWTSEEEGHRLQSFTR